MMIRHLAVLVFFSLQLGEIMCQDATPTIADTPVPKMKIGLIAHTFSKPKFKPIPLVNAMFTKGLVKKLADTIHITEKQAIDGLKIKTVAALTRVFNAEILSSKELSTHPHYDEVEAFPLLIDKVYREMILASGDKHFLPIEKMNVGAFFRMKKNYSEIAKRTCALLSLDAVAYCNWQVKIYGYTNYGSFWSSLVFNIYIIDNSGELIFEGYLINNSVEVQDQEPLNILQTILQTDQVFQPWLDHFQKPKQQKKLRKKGL